MKEEVQELIKINKQLLKRLETESESKTNVSSMFDKWAVKISAGFLVVVSVYFMTYMTSSSSERATLRQIIIKHEAQIETLMLHSSKHMTREMFFAIESVRNEQIVDCIIGVGRTANIKEEELEIARTVGLRNLKSTIKIGTTRSSER